jgi:hypothetical protein
MTFSRDDIAKYEAQPQTVVADKPAPVAAAEPVDATPAGDTADTDLTATPSGEDSSDPDVLGDGTSDVDADSSTATVDPSDDIEPPVKAAKGSAQERIQELNDLMHGYKEFGKAKADEVAALQARIAALEQGNAKPVVAAKADAVEVDEAMPDLADADVNFDTDKLKEKTQTWARQMARKEALRVLAETTNKNQVVTLRDTYEANAKTFAETHSDWKAVVDNPEFTKHQLADPAAIAVIKSGDLGPEIVYRMGKDVSNAARVAKMSVPDQLEYIGELKAEIKADRKAAALKPAEGTDKPVVGAKPAAKKSITQAPTPPSATRAAGRAQQRDETDPTLGMDDFAKQHRDRRQAARAQNRKLRGLD